MRRCLDACRGCRFWRARVRLGADDLYRCVCFVVSFGGGVMAEDWASRGVYEGRHLPAGCLALGDVATVDEELS